MAVWRLVELAALEPGAGEPEGVEGAAPVIRIMFA